jgi:carbonic anhydrase
MAIAPRVAMSAPPGPPMTDLDQLVDRNKHFATTQAYQALLISPRRQVCVVSCLDPRTDPVQTVQHDVELLRSSPVLPTQIRVSGHVYNVDTGGITTIVTAHD